jgi:hypothetical protein
VTGIYPDQIPINLNSVGVMHITPVWLARRAKPTLNDRVILMEVNKLIFRYYFLENYPGQKYKYNGISNVRSDLRRVEHVFAISDDDYMLTGSCGTRVKQHKA